MSKRGVGVLLVLTVIIAVGTIAIDYHFDKLMSEERAAGLARDREIGSISEGLAALRAAQAGYVAAGQGTSFWMSRVSELAAQIDGAIAAQRAATSTSTARGLYDAAASALSDFNAIDTRARTSVNQGDRLYASDLIFMDGLESNSKIAVALAEARKAEQTANEERLIRLSRLRLAVSGVATLFVLVVAAYFGRMLTRVEPKPAASTVQMIRDLPPPVKNSVTHPAQAAPPPPQSPRTVNLTAAAELCVDLARVTDGRDVPALLERAARVLEAKGVILWALNADGSRLHPSIAHGYPDRLMARLGTLQVDADNVTSMAYRSLRAQAVNGVGPSDSGAIAVPLITSSGCVGVLAAETRQNKPGTDILPVARIIAAQLAALVVPGEAGSQKAVQA